MTEKTLCRCNGKDEFHYFFYAYQEDFTEDEILKYIKKNQKLQDLSKDIFSLRDSFLDGQHTKLKVYDAELLHNS